MFGASKRRNSKNKDKNTDNGLEKASPKILQNIGCLMDLVNGSWVKGARGENVLNGGMSNINLIIGTGNNYKSTILHYINLQAFNRTNYALSMGLISLYDTEMNIDYSGLKRLTDNFEHLPESDPFEGNDAWWFVTDGTKYNSAQWLTEFVKGVEDIAKNPKDMITYDWYIDPRTGGTYKHFPPVQAVIDSFSEFTEPEAEKVIDKKGANSSESVTGFLTEGGFKTKVLRRFPRLTDIANVKLSMTAQLGEKKDMAGKYEKRASKQLQHLNPKDFIVGVSPKANYLITTMFHAMNAKNYIDDTKAPYYPADEFATADNARTELNKVNLVTVRSKNGASGVIIPIVVSQREGVLEDLTHFDYVRENNFGVKNSTGRYTVALYPDKVTTRKSIRKELKLDRDYAKAINFTADLFQTISFHSYLNTFYIKKYKKEIFCKPAELYEDIKELGYDWDVLYKTRNFHIPNQYDKKLLPFLSILDLLEMRLGIYIPYWLDKETKKIVEENIKKKFKE